MGHLVSHNQVSSITVKYMNIREYKFTKVRVTTVRILFLHDYKITELSDWFICDSCRVISFYLTRYL